MTQPWVYVSPSTSLPTPSLCRGLSQSTGVEHPASCIELAPVIYFTHVSVLCSQITPPSPSPTESKSLFFTSVSLLPSCMQGHRVRMPTSCISGLGRLPASAFYSLTGEESVGGAVRWGFPELSIAAILSVTGSCLTLCDPVDQSPPGSSLSMGFPRRECWSGFLFPFPGDLPNPGTESQVSCMAGRFFMISATRKP